MGDAQATVSSEPRWGLIGDAPEGVTVAWGARAIQVPAIAEERIRRGGGKGRVVRPGYPPSFDLLFDRQSWSSDDNATRAILSQALNGWALADARKAYAAAVRRGELDPRAPGRVTLVDKSSVVIVADTRGSHGYVYLGAWLL